LTKSWFTAQGHAATRVRSGGEFVGTPAPVPLEFATGLSLAIANVDPIDAKRFEKP
jgi:hypothetical protein